MAAVRSIFEYVNKKCYNGLYAAAEKYLSENWENMELRSSRVDHIENVDLVDAFVQRVYVTDLPGNRIAFDVGLELQIAVSSVDRHRDIDDECYQWIRISCEGDLSCGLDDWRINRIAVYSKQRMPENSMSDALVPEIRPDKYEDVATEFLREHYPEALRITKVGEPPVYVDPNVLAARLGLTVYTHRIREDGSVFGQLFFDEADAELFDAEKGENMTVHVPPHSIIVDPQMYLLRNLGSGNNTIVHECVHWDKHRKVFLLEKLYNDKVHGITCEVVGGAMAEMSRQATEKMERQANRLAPRIQMPAAPFKAKANEYIAKFMREMNAAYEVEVMEFVIQQLATDFVVSNQAAKIRLVELGFETAVGTFTFVDGRYVRPHSFKKGSIARSQTFTISGQDAAMQRFINPALRSLTAEGDYLFIENHYVFKAPLYVERTEEGHLQLTRYALSHMDECCLAFDMELKSDIRTEYHTICYLNREPVGYTFEIKYSEEFESKPKAQQIAMRKKEKEEEAELRRKMTDDPEQCLNLLLEWRGMTLFELATAIDKNERTLRRTLQERTTPKMETAVLICLGLNLPPSISEKLIETFGLKLIPTNPNHLWYREVIYTKWAEPVEDVQAYLKEYGIELK